MELKKLFFWSLPLRATGCGKCMDKCKKRRKLKLKKKNFSNSNSQKIHGSLFSIRFKKMQIREPPWRSLLFQFSKMFETFFRWLLLLCLGTRIGQASECFVYWKDPMTNDTWGLNFTSPIDAKQFRECCVSILRMEFISIFFFAKKKSILHRVLYHFLILFYFWFRTPFEIDFALR